MDVWDEDIASAGLNRGSQRARIATFWFLGSLLAAIGGFSAYHAWVMPEPVELGAGTVADLPAVPAPLAVALAEPPAAAACAPDAAPDGRCADRTCRTCRGRAGCARRCACADRAAGSCSRG